MRKPPIIGIYSPAPRSGKSTVADVLVNEFGYKRVPFAATLKSMFRVVMEDAGLSISDIADMENGDKNYQFCPAVSQATLREAYQTLGTEWGRQCMGKNFWCDLWALRVKPWLNHGVGVVVDDVRFDNEFTTVGRLAGDMWRVVRPGVDNMTTHASESYRPRDDQFAFDIINHGNVAELRNSVRIGMSP